MTPKGLRLVMRAYQSEGLCPERSDNRVAPQEPGSLFEVVSKITASTFTVGRSDKFAGA